MLRTKTALIQACDRNGATPLHIAAQDIMAYSWAREFIEVQHIGFQSPARRIPCTGCASRFGETKALSSKVNRVRRKTVALRSPESARDR